ncbi:hypothetical protein AZE42_10872 [Rhizopogon vesiculosus]|uniref:Uncharacterized protein n=1 Tax=Rhizopogon vesiculosus TaxID=180088 RepID=A0A1J8QRH8_9AGAM|nr:hypothetical protein AZE42_10872 [Rhizopogon vesiculosus]
MENIIAIGAGVALRVILDIATDNDHKLIGILIGLWEGVVLSHFLSKRTRSSRSKDPYLALATRLAIDLYLTQSLSRFALTCAWTLLGLLLADVAPSIWRDTGLRGMYKTLRRELRAIRKVLPRWKIENDLRIPKISIKNSVPGLFSRSPPSSVVSSTRAAPPASPVPVPTHKRRTPPGTYPGHSAISETNTEVSRVREVIPGPSPALIPTAADPAYRPPPFDLSPLSEDHIMIPDDNWVHVSVPSHSPERVHDLHVPPLTSEVGIQTSNADILSPSPRTRITFLPRIPNSDMDEPVPAHQVPLPESRPASVMGSVLSLFGARSMLSRARGDKATSDVGIDSTQHRASSTDGQRPAVGSAARQLYNQPSATDHHRTGSGPGPSMLRHVDDDDESVVGASVIGRGARTEPMFGGRSESLLGAGGAAFVGGLAVELRGAPEAFVGGFEAETTERENQAESFVGGFAAESGDASQSQYVPRESTVTSQNPPANPSQITTPFPDPPITTAMDINPMDSNPAANINTTTDESPAPDVDNPASAPNPDFITSQKQGGRRKKGSKNTTPVPSKSVTPAPPETTSQDQQHTFNDTPQPGPDLQNPATLTQEEAIPVHNIARSTLGMDTHGPDFPDGNPNSPPPPFKDVATPIEPTLLTQEQTDRESLRGEFLMRELKHLEVLVAKAETGVGRGSPSALSVERLNGIKERLVRVRMRVERRVYEDAPAELPAPPQLTLSGIDGLSAVDLVHTAIVDLLLETPHAEPLDVIGYINKQKRTSPKVVEIKTAVVDWVKENKFKVRTESATPFILNITF